jgi:hypothetical protein
VVGVAQDEDNQRERTAAIRILTDGGVGLVVGVVLGLAVASLSVAGVISMTIALTLLVAAWLITVLSTFVLGHIWKPTARERAVFAGCSAIPFILIGLVEEKYQPPSTASSAAVSPARQETASPIGPAVYIECHVGPLPTKVPPEGRIYAETFSIQPSALLDVPHPLAEFFGSPGAEWAWNAAGQGSRMADQCSLTNYEPYTIFNVLIPMSVTYRELITNSDNNSAIQSGRIVRPITNMVMIDRIVSGEDKSFTFYITNFIGFL